jgi:hypothetical protein
MKDRPILTTDQIGFARVLNQAGKDIEAIRLANRMLCDKDKEIAELRAALTLLLEKYVQAEHMGGFSMEQIDGFPEVILARKVLAE